MFETICFDICALAILAILAFALRFRKHITDAASKRLMLLIGVTFVAAISNILLNYHNGQGSYIFANYVCAGIYHIMRNGAYYLYASYIIEITGIRHKVEKLINRVKLIPFIIVVAIVLTAPFMNLFYFFDAEGLYIRGVYYSGIYLCNSIYAVYAFYYIVSNLRFIGKNKSMALSSCALFSIVTTVLQYEYPYLVIDILGFSLSLLYIVLYVDNPGDRIDSDSLLLRNQAYIYDLRMAFFTLKPIDIIHLNVVNHRELEQMLSYSSYSKVVMAAGEIFRETNSNGKYEGSLYYLKNGEFRVILNNNDRFRTLSMAKKLLEAFNKQIDINDMSLSLDISIFITQCPKDFSFIDEIMSFGRVVDQYAREGEIIFTADILTSEGYKQKGNMNQAIEKGILHNRFEVFYQPILNVNTGKFSVAEALIRLRDDDNNIIEPEEFIDVAEKNGAIFELGKIVLREVYNFISSDDFKKTDLESISINLSATQCLQRDLAEQVAELTKDYGDAKDRIIFEIRESMASDKQNTFTENMKELREMGVSFALDNFGMAYSNITSLSTLPIYAVKLDKKFVDTGGNGKHKDILESTMEMVKILNMRLVAVGIENEEMARQFTDYGCEYMQGYYFAKPMNRERLLRFYEEKNSAT